MKQSEGVLQDGDEIMESLTRSFKRDGFFNGADPSPGHECV